MLDDDSTSIRRELLFGIGTLDTTTTRAITELTGEIEIAPVRPGKRIWALSCRSRSWLIDVDAPVYDRAAYGTVKLW